MTQLIPQADSIGAELLEKVVLEGYLKQLKPEERMKYVQAVCSSLGLNPLTRPFQYIELNRKLTLYATKDATEQLARINNLSLEMRSTETIEGQRIVVYRATDATGRFADASGVVSIEGLKGDALSNQLMKAETKASRRAVLRVCGLGWLDETETETIPHATKITVSDNGDIGNTTKTEIKAVSATSDLGHGICSKHNEPYKHTDAQIAAGRLPSHVISGSNPTEWCQKPVASNDPDVIAVAN